MSHHLCASEHAYTGVTALLELFDGSFEAVSALLQVASNSVDLDVRRIEAGLAAGDAVAVADAAHRLTGTSGSITARCLADVSSSMERNAREGSLSGATALVPELHATARSLTAAIAAYARGGACGGPVTEGS